jgi:hypothetical protein
MNASSSVALRKARTGSNRGRGMLPNGKSKRTEDPFVRVSFRLLHAAAFKALSPAACTVLLLVMLRYHGKPADNGALPFAARDAEPWGLGRTVAAGALRELQAFGFLRCTEEANLLGRRARRWSCSELPTQDSRGHKVSPTFSARQLSQA